MIAMISNSTNRVDTHMKSFRLTVCLLKGRGKAQLTSVLWLVVSMFFFVNSLFAESVLPPCSNTDSVPLTKCHGQRIMDGGIVYIGDFSGGKMNGHGTYIRPDGSRFEGQFIDNKFSGMGTYTTSKGVTITGEFREGQFPTRGVLIGPSSKYRYEGELNGGKPHGFGQINWSDGRSYVGHFENGQLNGTGVFTHPNGETVSGEFTDGKVLKNSTTEPLE